MLAFADQLPSLFRGVVIADSPVGVRVVSVEESSQAYQADLRPEDVIIRIHGEEIDSINDFAAYSLALKGRMVETTVVVFRHGKPHVILLHLYSYPVLRAWGIEFVPNHDVRFAQAHVGLDYWMRFGRGFEEADNPADALDAYLNALHNVPTHVPAAFKATELYLRLGQKRLRAGKVPEGVAVLAKAMAAMERLFDYPLSDAQLECLTQQLKATLEAMKTVKGSS